MAKCGWRRARSTVYVTIEDPLTLGGSWYLLNYSNCAYNHTRALKGPLTRVRSRRTRSGSSTSTSSRPCTWAVSWEGELSRNLSLQSTGRSHIVRTVTFIRSTGPLTRAEDASVLSTNWAANKSLILLWFSSKGCTGPHRHKRAEVFQTLSSHLPAGTAHIYGACGKRDPCYKDGRATILSPSKAHMAPGSCMQKLVSPYKFYAAFENSRCRGYITEKFRAKAKP